MLGIGWSEILIILVIALVVLGPEKLPELARLVAKLMRDLREVTEDVRIQLDQATRDVRGITDNDFLKSDDPQVADHYPHSLEHQETEDKPEPQDETPPGTPSDPQKP